MSETRSKLISMAVLMAMFLTAILIAGQTSPKVQAFQTNDQQNTNANTGKKKKNRNTNSNSTMNSNMDMNSNSDMNANTTPPNTNGTPN